MQVWGLGCPKICGQPRGPGGPGVRFLPGLDKTSVPAQGARQEERSLPWRRVWLFVLFRPSGDWIRPTHTREGRRLIHFRFKC